MKSTPTFDQTDEQGVPQSIKLYDGIACECEHALLNLINGAERAFRGRFNEINALVSFSNGVEVSEMQVKESRSLMVQGVDLEFLIGGLLHMLAGLRGGLKDTGLTGIGFMYGGLGKSKAMAYLTFKGHDAAQDYLNGCAQQEECNDGYTNSLGRAQEPLMCGKNYGSRSSLHLRRVTWATTFPPTTKRYAWDGTTKALRSCVSDFFKVTKADRVQRMRKRAARGRQR